MAGSRLCRCHQHRLIGVMPRPAYRLLTSAHADGTRRSSLTPPSTDPTSSLSTVTLGSVDPVGGADLSFDSSTTRSSALIAHWRQSYLALLPFPISKSKKISDYASPRSDTPKGFASPRGLTPSGSDYARSPTTLRTRPSC